MNEQYDHIAEVDVLQEVEKSQVEKFNPFHDRLGRFASSSNFSRYSANPKSKAGRMAIERSYKAGHKNTFNSHKESKGENVSQNYQWLQTGSFSGRRKPVGYNGKISNNGLRSSTSKPKTTTTSKPAASNKPKTTSKPAAQQNPAAAKKPSTNRRKPVDGKDITKKFKYDASKKTSALDQVAEQQGFKGKPKVVKNVSKFQDAIAASGTVMYRTINKGRDVVTGKTRGGDEFIDDMKNSDKFSHNGFGGQVYGGGIYTAGAVGPKGQKPNRMDQDKAMNDSAMYGNGYGKMAAMTLDPSAKIADYRKMSSDFKKLSKSERAKYDDDVGAYAAAKGYDAMRNSSGSTNYTIVYNRSKLIVFDAIYDEGSAPTNF